MKSTFTSRILPAALVLAAMVLATSAFSARGIITIKPGTSTSSGKTYTSQIDANGKFSFKNVAPGTYKLYWVLPEGRNPDNTGDCSLTIESFSWGASNQGSMGSSGMSGGRAGKSTPSLITGTDPQTTDAQGKSTPVTRSNISNNRSSGSGGGAGKVSFQDLHFSKPASGFIRDGYQLMAQLSEEFTVGNDAPDVGGTISGMAINEKGLPGEKKPAKGTK